MKYLMLCLLLIGCSDPTEKVEYSHFTYVGPTLYECSKESHVGYGSYTLYDCVSINGSKIDRIYNASNWWRQKR